MLSSKFLLSINVFSPPFRRERKELWNQVHKIGSELTTPWEICLKTISKPGASPSNCFSSACLWDVLLRHEGQLLNTEGIACIYGHESACCLFTWCGVSRNAHLPFCFRSTQNSETYLCSAISWSFRTVTGSSRYSGALHGEASTSTSTKWPGDFSESRHSVLFGRPRSS